ncbi:hypothetical protein NC652_029131 [Populus alba x Populus x berolinensis]|nr:hypothetical protein NC652_029131 [Populus alba x Populus x berolinensis]
MEIAGKLKPLEDCTATPNPDCGCSRGLNHLFCSYCYGNGSNHLIFVTRIKEFGHALMLEDCTATPNPNCGCSHCYGNGSRGLLWIQATF